MTDHTRDAVAMLAHDAAQLAREHGDHQQAKRRKALAENAALSAVLEAVKPALPAISSRVQGLAGPLKRAVHLGDYREQVPLYLGSEGDFFEHVGPQSVVCLTPEQVLDRAPLSAILAVLVTQVRSQLGSYGATAEKIEREAAILEGLAQALKVGGVR